MKAEIVISVLFSMIILFYVLNISTRIKMLFNIRISRTIKLIDCFPCLSWWVGLTTSVIAIGFNIEALITAMCIYIIAFIIDRQ